MTVISRIDGAAAAVRPPMAPSTGGVFIPAESTPKTAAPAAIAPADLTPLLGLQEDGPGERTRRVHRRARDMLACLAALQRTLVVGADPEAVLRELSSLRESAEHSGDPILDDLMQSVGVRVRVERARYGL